MESGTKPLAGFLLSLTTAILWGILPVFLKLCLQVMDSATITLYRFASAGLVVAIILWSRKRLPKLKGHSHLLWLTFLATVLLVVNYVTNVMSLNFLSPASVQVLMQLAPLILMLGGVWLYAESFSTMQRWGAVTLISGLLLFFNQRLPQIMSSADEDTIGFLFVTVAAVSWAGYALTQKRILGSFSAMQLTLLLYVMGTVMLLPMSELSSIANMDSRQLFALVFCCLNTLVAYGAFTEALRIWYASRVSAVLSLAPLFTYLSMRIAESVWPNDFNQPELTWIAYLGGIMVIGGSIITALGKDKQLQQTLTK